MPYKLLIILLSLSNLSGQSVFNRWIGSDPYMGSTRSIAMGNTHLLNSNGSSTTRFNPSNLVTNKSTTIFNIQIDRLSVFERRSMIMQNSFGDFLEYGDYVSNEFAQHMFHGGLSSSINFFGLAKLGIGIHTSPLNHFNYQYIEEIRGTNQIEDGEYASKDPIIGYHHLNTKGLLQVSSIGLGFGIKLINDNELNIGVSINEIHQSSISDLIEIDTLNSDVTNLSTLPEINQTTNTNSSNFITLSSNYKLSPKIKITFSWEDSTLINSPNWTYAIDNFGLFQFWHNGNYAYNGHYYLKPEIYGLGFSYISNQKTLMSISFEFNQILYHKHLNLIDYKKFKFGFEYFTQSGTPIRAGLTYQTPMINTIEPISIFTFGSGKKINDLTIDFAATYSLQKFFNNDIFPVENDTRPYHDTIHESQFHLSISLSYQL